MGLVPGSREGMGDRDSPQSRLQGLLRETSPHLGESDLSLVASSVKKQNKNKDMWCYLYPCYKEKFIPEMS